MSRRAFLQRLSALGLAGVGGSALLSACGGGEQTESTDPSGHQQTATVQCNDLSGLTEPEQQSRQQMVEALQYVEESPRENQRCSNCNFWVPAEGSAPCGGCQLIRGPIHPDGYCTSWVPQSG